MTADAAEARANDVALYDPTARDMITLEVPVEAKISPGGGRVAIRVRTANWRDNCYEYTCYVHELASGAACPLHRTGSALQVEWLDDQTLALLKEEPGDGDPQVWLYEGLIGEGWLVTEHKTGVEWFKPFAGGLLYRASRPEREERKVRADRYGRFTHWEQEESASALYYVGLAELRRYGAEAKASTEDEAGKLPVPVIELSRLLPERLSIRDVVPSPMGDALYLNCWQRDDRVHWRDTSAFRIGLDAGAALAEHLRRERASNAEQKETSAPAKKPSEDASYLGQIARLNLPRGAAVVAISPDGQTLLVAHRGRDERMFTREDLWTLDLDTALAAPDPAATLAAMHNLSAALDQELYQVYWVSSGIYVSYPESTHMRVARLGEDGQAAPLDLGDIFPAWSYHISNSGSLVLVGANAQVFQEAYLAHPPDEAPRGDGPTSAPAGPWRLKRLTHYGQAVQGWALGTVETIRWVSRDGTEIEGVLCKPSDFDPTHKYPLAFVVHGGPMGSSEEYRIGYEDLGYYPTWQLVNKGVLVLKPNYRGSVGRGQAFAELNVNNLGVGDLWDLESAIDHLVSLGWVDCARVGCMGWSQGGYISAYAGLHSDRFCAVSVGAGVSDWYTYHISNDIPDFTVDYLSASPFRNRELYVKTAPISNITQAKTPMLIQHGTEDRRVPFSNAMELYRGLKEMGVPVELYAFPGMGHPITRPRENHAVMHQNLAWFSHYLLGEELQLE